VSRQKNIEVIFKHISNHEHNVIKTNKNSKYNIKWNDHNKHIVVQDKEKKNNKEKRIFKYTYTNIKV